jgi:hypothetical protein
LSERRTIYAHLLKAISLGWSPVKETNPSLLKLTTLYRMYKIEPNEFFVKSGVKKAARS